MSNYDYFKVLENLEKLEETMNKVSLYNRTRGGGILWIICYWPLYFLFLYELTIIRKDITLVSEMVGICLFFAVGVFLTWGVYRQIRLLEYYHRDQIKDYEKVVESISRFNKTLEKSNPELLLSATSLFRLIIDFRKKFFPRRGEEHS